MQHYFIYLYPIYFPHLHFLLSFYFPHLTFFYEITLNSCTYNNLRSLACPVRTLVTFT
jgi:hypothetical protein